MQFSVWPAPSRSTDEILDAARMADEGAWYGVWFADHYMPDTDDGATADGDVHEAWCMLPAIAAVTSRVRMGPLVSPTSVHHPALLAKRAASIDRLSHGRFVLGMGAGWQVNEHQAYGIELHEPRQRVDRFEEAIGIVRSMLGEDRTTLHGEHFRVTDAPCQPRPVQTRLPILVGTSSPRMMRITARYADEWNAWGSPATIAGLRDDLRHACDSVGRDPDSIWVSAQPLLFLVDDHERAARLRASAPADRSIIGSVPEITEALARYADIGVDEVIIGDFTLGRDPAERRDTYERIATEILPHLTPDHPTA